MLVENFILKNVWSRNMKSGVRTIEKSRHSLSNNLRYGQDPISKRERPPSYEQTVSTSRRRFLWPSSGGIAAKLKARFVQRRL